MNQRQFGQILANSRPWQPKPLLSHDAHAAFLRQMTLAARRKKQADAAWKLVAPDDAPPCDVEVDAHGRVLVVGSAATVERLQRQVASLQARLRQHLIWLRRLEFSVARVSNP